MSSSEKPCVCLRRVAPRVNGGHLQNGGRAPSSEFGDFPSHIAGSLRRIFEIFPLLGDSDPTPGSTRHCVVGLALNSVGNDPKLWLLLAVWACHPLYFL